MAFLLFSFTFGLESLSDHELSVTLFLVGLEFLLLFKFFLFLLKFIDGGYDRSSNKYFKKGLDLKIKIEEISSLNLYSIIKASFFGLELRVWGFINIEIPFDLVLGEGLSLYGLKLIILVVGFVIKIFVLTLTIFLFGLELFGYCVKPVLVGGGFGLTDHRQSLIIY